MNTIWSVETEANSYQDDLFTGTRQECVDYCANHDLASIDYMSLLFWLHSGVKMCEIYLDEDMCCTGVKREMTSGEDYPL